jgi:hypothetical protein
MPSDQPPDASPPHEQSAEYLQASGADELLEVLWLCAPSVILSVAVSAVVGFVPQAHEAVRATLENCAEGFVWPLVALAVSLGLASVALWYWARATLYVTIDGLSQQRGLVGPPTSRLGRWALDDVPRIAGALPWLGMAAAFFRAEHLTSSTGFGWGDFGALLCLAVGVGLYVFWRRRRARIGGRGYVPSARPSARLRGGGRKHGVDLTHLSSATTRLLALAFAAYFLVALATLSGPGAWARGSGPIAVVFVWVATWVSLVAGLRLFGKYHGIPILSIGAALSLLLNLRDWNDNHAVQRLPTNATPTPDTTVASAFRAWYATRVDRARYAGPYPVFVVATEGGGIRAAYFTASLLAELQDRCPAFAHHLFAVSGVSGGSVGAAVFAATVASRPRYDTAAAAAAACGGVAADSTFAHVAHEMLGRDLLSPVVATWLNVDVFQRGVLPLFCFPRLWCTDRARALEDGLERGWDAATAHDPPNAGRFAAPFAALRAHPDVPLPLFNSTLVGTGDRALVTTLGRLEADSVPTLRALDSTLAVRVSTAAVLGARFPYVTPEGVIRRDGATYRLVDGGYFDDSGVTTARQVADAIDSSTAGGAVRVVVLHFAFEAPPRGRTRPGTAAADSAQRERAADSARVRVRGSAFAEVTTPVVALFNTRAAHARAAVRQYRLRLEHDSAAGRPGAQLVDFWLREDSVPLILGWYLSKKARANIDGATRRCGDGAVVGAAPSPCTGVFGLLRPTAAGAATPP